jgi:hypothetical protein
MGLQVLQSLDVALSLLQNIFWMLCHFSLALHLCSWYLSLYINER